MHDIKIVREEFHEYTDEKGNSVKSPWYTFTVDDVPSMQWFRECLTPDLGPTYFVQRCINRLRQGRSSEAFGSQYTNEPGRGKVMLEPGPVKYEIIKVSEGIKRREIRKGWVYTLDGVQCEKVYTTEQEAKSACAIAAFMTRHKAGQIENALTLLQEEFPESECKVWACAETHGIRVTVDGEEYAIGWIKDESGKWSVEKFKKIFPEETEA